MESCRESILRDGFVCAKSGYAGLGAGWQCQDGVVQTFLFGLCARGANSGSSGRGRAGAGNTSDFLAVARVPRTVPVNPMVLCHHPVTMKVFS